MTPTERQGVERELASIARHTRALGWLLGIAAFLSGVSMVAGVLREAWPLALSGLIGLLVLGWGWQRLLLMARAVESGSALELEATQIHGLCRTVSSSNKKRRSRFVGPYEVHLPEGWQMVWPEGKTVLVELCFPPSAMPTSERAIVVTLPAVSFQKASKHPLPAPRRWLSLLPLVGCISLVMAAVGLLNEPYRSDVVSHLRNLGHDTSFASVAELVAARRAVGARVSIARAYLVDVPALGQHLCDLSERSKRVLLDAASQPLSAPELDAINEPSSVLRHELRQDSSNACLPIRLSTSDEFVYAALSSSPDRVSVIAVENQKGVVDKDGVWRANAHTTVFPFYWLLASLACIFCGYWYMRRNARRFNAERSAWLRATRDETGKS